MTVISYILAVVETASLIGALVSFTRAMHENKLKRKTKGKKGARSDFVMHHIIEKKLNLT